MIVENLAPILIDRVSQSVIQKNIPKLNPLPENIKSSEFNPLPETNNAYFYPFNESWGGVEFVGQEFFNTLTNITESYETLQIPICVYSFDAGKELVITQTDQCEIIEMTAKKNYRVTIDFTLLALNQRPSEFEPLLFILNAPTELKIKSGILDEFSKKYGKEYHSLVCESYNYVTENIGMIKISANFIEVVENAIYL